MIRETRPDTQIIVSKELDRKAHVWLRALSDKMGKQDMEDLLKIESMKQKLDRELAEFVLKVSVRANQHVVEEMGACVRHYWKFWNRKSIKLGKA